MISTVLSGAGALLIPALAIVIDGFAAVHARNRVYRGGNQVSHGFRLLVPIWGDIRYLTNIDALAPYGRRVTLCTTGDESKVFYASLNQVARKHGFHIYIDRPQKPWTQEPTSQKARATDGTTRDRLIRHVLGYVREPIVIPIDADSIPASSFEYLAGELMRRGLDLASVRIVPANPDESVLTRLQALEYRIVMQIKFVAPWMLSGACHAARTHVLRDVMNRHSLFFQGNDVETGVLAYALGYRVGHIAFEVLSDVPVKFKPWLRQRLAWAGGQFRLFIVNFQFGRRHPFMWLYGAGVVYLALLFRYHLAMHSASRVVTVVVGYVTLVLYLYLRRGRGKWWALAMPFYTLLLSFVVTPLGIIWYVKMAISSNNWGIIRPRANHKLKISGGTWKWIAP
jgi:hypothetical protein